MTPPLSLSLLSLTPLPIDTIPTPSSSRYADFTATLAAEANALLNHPAWGQHKVWHEGQGLEEVETRGLPLDVVTLEAGEWHAEPAPTADGADKKRRGFFGGVGGGAKEQKGWKAEREALHNGVAWHMRTSTIASDQYPYHVWHDALAVDHAKKEAEYIASLSRVVDVDGAGTILKLYALPFPTTNRSFLAHLIVLETETPSPTADAPPLRSFQVFSLPASTPKPLPEDKGYVRGSYVAVEEIREVVGEDGKLVIEWRCASQSTPGGNIPTRIAQSHMASSMASDIPAIFAWLAKQYGPPSDPKHSHPSLFKRLSMSGLKHLPKRGSTEPKPDAQVPNGNGHGEVPVSA
ncbi:hypothetical protein MNV49_000033 [Pseudohyphozyma bogoriensis]|nr:hypothetical protein MNV49_000033 [Pseudohyphozyma bogoriensis]